MEGVESSWDVNQRTHHQSNASSIEWTVFGGGKCRPRLPTRPVRALEIQSAPTVFAVCLGPDAMICHAHTHSPSQRGDSTTIPTANSISTDPLPISRPSTDDRQAWLPSVGGRQGGEGRRQAKSRGASSSSSLSQGSHCIVAGLVVGPDAHAAIHRLLGSTGPAPP